MLACQPKGDDDATKDFACGAAFQNTKKLTDGPYHFPPGRHTDAAAEIPNVAFSGHCIAYSDKMPAPTALQRAPEQLADDQTLPDAPPGIYMRTAPSNKKLRSLTDLKP